MSDNPFEHIEDPEVEEVSKEVKHRIEGSQNLIKAVFSTLELYVSNLASSIVAVLQSYSNEGDDKNNFANNSFSSNNKIDILPTEETDIEDKDDIGFSDN